MKVKNIIIGGLAAIMLLSMTSCQLAKEDLPEGKSQDRLIGVFITAQHLDRFDMENGRLYAKLTARELTNEETGQKSSIQEYFFEGKKGILFFSAEMTGENGDSYSSSYCSEGLSETNLSINVGDDDEKHILDAVIYLAPNMNVTDVMTQYVNPVYQEDNGKVYLVEGQGISAGGMRSEGDAFSQRLEESITVSENGKEKTKTTTINISFKTKLPPEKVVVIEMDKDSNIVKKQECMPGKLPESITADIDTDYFIVESYKIDFDGKEKVSRAVFSRDDEGLDSLFAIDNGIVINQRTVINWQYIKGMPQTSISDTITG